MRRLKELIPLLLLASYLSYQAGITLFTHAHYINGVMVVHSHPSKSKQHTHTEEQYLFIHQLSHAHMLEAHAPAVLEAPVRHPVLLCERIIVDSVLCTVPTGNHLRAPPALYSSYCL